MFQREFICLYDLFAILCSIISSLRLYIHAHVFVCVFVICID